MNLSYEFFPPRQAGQERRLWHTVGCLDTQNPGYYSMTYGALGTDAEISFQMIEQLHEATQTPIAAHLTCIGQTRDTVIERLKRLRTLGVSHIVALRGDRPKQTVTTDTGLKDEAKIRRADNADELQHASELVELISEFGGFEVSVAAYPDIHPEASSASDDLIHLKNKLDAGAKRAITQFFYDTDRFLRFRDKAAAEGITDLVPGILPVHDIDNVTRFAERCGAVVPKDLIDKFKDSTLKPGESHKLAIEHGYELCRTLQEEGISDFHFYTLNQSDLSYEITRHLNGTARVADTLAA